MIIQQVGPTVAVSKKLTTTSATTIYTGKKNIFAECISIRVTNTDSTARTVTVQRYDDSASESFDIASGQSIAANTSELIDLAGLRLDPGDEIRATAGLANTMHVVLTMRVINGRNG